MANTEWHGKSVNMNSLANPGARLMKRDTNRRHKN
jgi:hypothetical protein